MILKILAKIKSRKRTQNSIKQKKKRISSTSIHKAFIIYLIK